jgi:hypothetical protein
MILLARTWSDWMLSGSGASGTARVCAKAAGIAADTIAAMATAVVIFDTVRSCL